MPNWCSNTVSFTHSDPTFIKRAETAFADGKFLEEFIPVPKDLHIVSGSVGESGSPEQDELEAKAKANLEKYGYKDWYDFCVNEWGTKWDVGNSDGINVVTESTFVVYFDSAWAPPISAYERLSEMGFKIDAMYYEPGMCFAGRWTTEDGDDYYDYTNMSSQEVAEGLPQELDEAFGISEQLAEWEAENNEDDE